MLELKINPIVYNDLKNIFDYVAEDNEIEANRIINELYNKFKNLQLFPDIGSPLSSRGNFKKEFRYAVWNNYIIIYKVLKDTIFIYRVISRYQDITKIFK